MDRVSRIATLEDMKLWAAEHGGRTDEKWKKQDEHDTRCARDFAMISKRLTAVEKKVMWISGVFAGIGALLGTLLTRIAGG